MATAGTITTPTTEPLVAEAAVSPAPPSSTQVVDEPLYEVIDGQIVEKPAMGAPQVWIASQFVGWLFASGIAGRAVAEMLFVLDSARNLKRRPDVALVSYDRWPRRRPIPDGEAWNVVPDLAVEVISPSNSADEVVKKVGEYVRAGVRLVWVVYPLERLVYVYRSAVDVRVLQIGDELDGGDVLAGFRRPVRDLFEEEGETEPEPEAPSTPAVG